MGLLLFVGQPTGGANSRPHISVTRPSVSSAIITRAYGIANGRIGKWPRFSAGRSGPAGSGCTADGVWTRQIQVHHELLLVGPVQSGCAPLFQLKGGRERSETRLERYRPVGRAVAVLGRWQAGCFNRHRGPHGGFPSNGTNERTTVECLKHTPSWKEEPADTGVLVLAAALILAVNKEQAQASQFCTHKGREQVR